MLTICCASLGSKGAFAIRHIESLRSLRIGWLRPAVLEANGGIVSTASLIVGVAAGDVATQLMANGAKEDDFDRGIRALPKTKPRPGS